MAEGCMFQACVNTFHTRDKSLDKRYFTHPFVKWCWTSVSSLWSQNSEILINRNVQLIPVPHCETHISNFTVLVSYFCQFFLIYQQERIPPRHFKCSNTSFISCYPTTAFNWCFSLWCHECGGADENVFIFKTFYYSSLLGFSTST